MIVKVALLHDDEGRPIPKHRRHFLKPTILGDFTFTDAWIDAYGRMGKVAALWQIGGQAQVLPQLVDAALQFGKGADLVVRGNAQDIISQKMTAQCWHMEVQGAVLAPPAGAPVPPTTMIPPPAPLEPGEPAEPLPALASA